MGCSAGLLKINALVLWIFILLQLFILTNILYKADPLVDSPIACLHVASSPEFDSNFHLEVALESGKLVNPVSLAWDSLGRLWALDRCPANSSEEGETKTVSRIWILEDSDNDGSLDEQKLFSSLPYELKSITVGLGGVWALSDVNLILISDWNNDDVPDKSPVVVVDVLNEDGNSASASCKLRWGNDGWLYCAHSNSSQSISTLTEATKKERIEVANGVWRFHPTKRKIEIVSNLTFGPSIIDWDENGYVFVAGNWSNGQRNLLKHSFLELSQSPTNHTLRSNSSEKNAGPSALSDAADRGQMYNSNQFPEKYRGKLVVVKGSEIVSEEFGTWNQTSQSIEGSVLALIPDKDFITSDLCVAFDGSIYVAGHTRKANAELDSKLTTPSNIIYKLTYGQMTTYNSHDIHNQTDETLISFIESSNACIVAQSRLEMATRNQTARIMGNTFGKIATKLRSPEDSKHRLQYLLTLLGCGMNGNFLIQPLLKDGNEHVRIHALRTLCDSTRVPFDHTMDVFGLLQTEKSEFVRSHILGLLPRLRGKAWWQIVQALFDYEGFQSNVDQVDLAWYAIKKMVIEQPRQGTALVLRIAGQNLIKKSREANDSQADEQKAQFQAKLLHLAIRDFIALVDQEPNPLSILLQSAGNSRPELQQQILVELYSQLYGRKQMEQPATWEIFSARFKNSVDPHIRLIVTKLDSIFGSGLTLEQLSNIVRQTDDLPECRQRALHSIEAVDPVAACRIAFEFTKDPSLQKTAQSIILENGDLDAVKKLTELQLDDSQSVPSFQVSLVDGLLKRQEFLPLMIEAIENNRIDRGLISSDAVRQLIDRAPPELRERAKKLWPDVN